MNQATDEQAFVALADTQLAKLEAALEAAIDQGAEIDYELKPGGIIEIEFADESKIIVNRHTAAREIWLAARSGGFHFRWDGSAWRGTRDGEELLAVLSRCASQQAGEPVSLSR